MYVMYVCYATLYMYVVMNVCMLRKGVRLGMFCMYVCCVCMVDLLWCAMYECYLRIYATYACDVFMLCMYHMYVRNAMFACMLCVFVCFVMRV